MMCTAQASSTCKPGVPARAPVGYGVGMVEVTFRLDDETMARLRRIARRLVKSQSRVVRDAIVEYDARTRKLTVDERHRMLEVFDRLVPKIPLRPPAQADAELREIRSARRCWSRSYVTPPKG